MRVTSLLLTILILAFGLSLAENPRDMKFEPLKFDPPEPVRFATDNGIVVYFLEDHQLPVLTFSAYFHGGTVQDSPDKAGLADLTATLMRSGGAGKRTPDQVDDDLDFFGITLSSGTGDEHANIRMNLLTKDINTGFEILSDIIERPLFDSSKIDHEISNRKDEIRRQNDDPHDISRRVYYQTVYGDHPYGLYPTLASMSNITRPDLIAWHDKFYSPDNCIMALSGDITVEELKALISKYFGGWKKSGAVITNPPQAVAKFKPGVYYAEKNINQANIRFGTLCMTDKNPDRYAMEVMNFALGGSGFTSRIMQKVRTAAGLAYSVGTYNFNRPFMGTLFGYCQTKAEQFSQALQMMFDIIADVKKNGITADEMELAKESIINSYVFNYDTPSRLVDAKAMLELGGFSPDQLQKDLEAYQAVTLEQCNAAAKKYLDIDNIAIVLVGEEQLFDKPISTFGPVKKVSLEIK